MNSKIDDFVEEITDNFSNLFVEAFFIRYFDKFNEKNLLPTIEKTYTKLQEKLEVSFVNRLKNIKNDK